MKAVFYPSIQLTTLDPVQQPRQAVSTISGLSSQFYCPESMNIAVSLLFQKFTRVLDGMLMLLMAEMRALQDDRFELSDCCSFWVGTAATQK